MAKHIDWHALGIKLRAIDFHFVWMVTSEPSAWLWHAPMEYDRAMNAMKLVSGCTRSDFAAAAGYLHGIDARPEHIRKCDRAYIESQRRKVGTIFGNLGTHGMLLRMHEARSCETTLWLPIK